MFSSNTSQVSNDAVFVEDVFSTYLYTGNGSTQTITNGIDLAGKGGLVWVKSRDSTYWHHLADTARGVNNTIFTNDTAAQVFATNRFTSFNSNGFSLGNSGGVNSAEKYASWTFRKQPKFFDVVTYTGNGTTQNIAHSLGSKPGFIVVKQLDGSNSWLTYHQALGASYRTVLNLTNASLNNSPELFWGNLSTAVEPTSTQFTIGNHASLNNSGSTYVAYLFAHDAGGFGLTGTDNVISCGSFTSDSGGNATVTLGYEPQWLLYKSSSSSDSWYIFDSMRKWTADGAVSQLIANSSAAEANSAALAPTATGFTSPGLLAASTTYIYIAIRRGPMRTPTTGTSVYTSSTGTNSATIPTFTANFPVDWIFAKNPAATFSWEVAQRLTGGYGLAFNSTAAQSGPLSDYVFDSNIGAWTNYPNTFRSWMFRRAPGFFDVVCYTGTGVAQNITHNLGVVPELMIVKRRSGTAGWATWGPGLGTGSFGLNSLLLNDTAAAADNGAFLNLPTATQFSVSIYGATNASGSTYVAYLFASCPGVSKVGSYTGTGALQTINCGFTGGARFVLIKRTDSTGDWFTYDSARGITSGNDPYLLMNSTAAEVTGTNYVDTTSVGFQVTAAAPAGLNANGGTYIFLAIA